MVRRRMWRGALQGRLAFPGARIFRRTLILRLLYFQTRSTWGAIARIQPLARESDV